MITNAQNINYKYLSLCPLHVLLLRRLPSSSICTRRPCSSTARLFCQGAVMHMLRTVRNKTHDAEALVRACSAWAIRGSKNTQICCSERMSGTRPPTPVQITPELPTATVFYSRVARNLVGSREKQCGDDGDDLITAVGISLPRWSSNAVIVTALLWKVFKLTLAFGIWQPLLNIQYSRLLITN